MTPATLLFCLALSGPAADSDPVHVLVIPKRHVAAMNELQDSALLGRLFHVANLVAQKKGIAVSGYRVVANTGRDGGQSVFHLHLHVLGGRQMNWPPG